MIQTIVLLSVLTSALVVSLKVMRTYMEIPARFEDRTREDELRENWQGVRFIVRQDGTLQILVSFADHIEECETPDQARILSRMARGAA